MKLIMIVTLSLVMTFTSGASAFGQKKSKSEPQAEINAEDKEKKSRVARPDKGDRALPAATCCDSSVNATSQSKTRGDRPFPATPCCSINAIDSDNGIVTARNATTGETFQFEVASRSLLRSLQVGQKVYADIAAKKAGVKPAVPCCEITNRKRRS